MLRLLLLLAFFGLAACQKHAPLDSESEAKSATTSAPGKQNKPAARHMSIAGMSPSFLYLASQKAIREGNNALAIELLNALVKQDPDAVEPHF